MQVPRDLGNTLDKHVRGEAVKELVMQKLVMQKLVVLALLIAACGGKAVTPTSPSAHPGNGPATGFAIVENGRDVVAPAADGSFRLDGPATFVITTSGSLSSDGKVLLAVQGAAIAAPGQPPIATITDRGLDFGQGAIELRGDGNIVVTRGANPNSKETFAIRGLTDQNRRAVLTLLAWLLGAPATQPAASSGS